MRTCLLGRRGTERDVQLGFPSAGFGFIQPDDAPEEPEGAAQHDLFVHQVGKTMFFGVGAHPGLPARGSVAMHLRPGCPVVCKTKLTPCSGRCSASCQARYQCTASACAVVVAWTAWCRKAPPTPVVSGVLLAAARRDIGLRSAIERQPDLAHDCRTLTIPSAAGPFCDFSCRQLTLTQATRRPVICPCWLAHVPARLQRMVGRHSSRAVQLTCGL